MANFFHSWAFWFIIGCFVGGTVGFITAALCAASSKRSRAEDELIYEAVERQAQRRGDYLPEKLRRVRGSP